MSSWHRLARLRTVHLLAAVLIPFGTEQGSIRPIAARDAALWARLDTLLFQYEQPETYGSWGIDHARGFQFDWWSLGGRYAGWGREVRSRIIRQHLAPTVRPIPRFLERNAAWSDDLARVRLVASILPNAILTPHGAWHQPSMILLGGKLTVRERKAMRAWVRKIRRLMLVYEGYLAIGVDYHF